MNRLEMRFAPTRRAPRAARRSRWTWSRTVLLAGFAWLVFTTGGPATLGGCVAKSSGSGGGSGSGSSGGLSSSSGGGSSGSSSGSASSSGGSSSSTGSSSGGSSSSSGSSSSGSTGSSSGTVQCTGAGTLEDEQPCASDEECCSGLCLDEVCQGTPSTVTCDEDALSCAADVDCCSGICTNGVCEYDSVEIDTSADDDGTGSTSGSVLFDENAAWTTEYEEPETDVSVQISKGNFLATPTALSMGAVSFTGGTLTTSITPSAANAYTSFSMTGDLIPPGSVVTASWAGAGAVAPGSATVTQPDSATLTAPAITSFTVTLSKSSPFHIAFTTAATPVGDFVVTLRDNQTPTATSVVVTVPLTAGSFDVKAMDLASLATTANGSATFHTVSSTAITVGKAHGSMQALGPVKPMGQTSAVNTVVLNITP